MPTLGLLLLPALFAATEPVPLCSIGRVVDVRPSRSIGLTLRATRDSVRDPHGAALTDFLRRETGELPPWDTTAAFGQRFEVRHIVGEEEARGLRAARNVVLLWWRLGTTCARVSPRPAVRRDLSNFFIPARLPSTPAGAPGEPIAVVALLRPRELWIGGLPTIDVGEFAWSYAPSEQQPRVSGEGRARYEALTLREYRDFFSRLPTYGGTREEQEDQRRRLLAWGDADPTLWSRYPSYHALCSARAYLGIPVDDKPACSPWAPAQRRPAR